MLFNSSIQVSIIFGINHGGRQYRWFQSLRHQNHELLQDIQVYLSFSIYMLYLFSLRTLATMVHHISSICFLDSRIISQKRNNGTVLSKRVKVNVATIYYVTSFSRSIVCIICIKISFSQLNLKYFYGLELEGIGSLFIELEWM